MVGKMRLARWAIGAVILAATACAGVLAIELATTEPAQAQYRRSSPGGFFQELFGNPGYRRYEPQSDQSEQHYSTHAPSPRKPAANVAPTTSIVVIGDGMADWLAYGLEDAFADEPEVAIDRQSKYNSGLLRYDAKGDLDWWHVARDIVTKEKANYVVMMLGVSDRDNIREKDLAKEAEKQKAENPQSDNKPADKDDTNAAPDQKPGEDQSIAAPEPKAKKASGAVEFRSDQWAAIYSRRIDDTIAALKSKGVPVFWVGLPSIRGTKSTTDTVYLNELYRARAERAGITYIDVWDGFVDEAGKYSTFGPDYEGQTRRLRSGDGVYFTKYGARKLAHYVEREIRRYMSNRVPVALPSAPIAVPQSASKGPAVRPLAGPVVPLTVTTTSNADQLLGAAGTRPTYGDANATDVLVKGEPVNAPHGRADDFMWQGGESSGSAPSGQPGPAAAAPAGQVPPVIRQVEPPSANTTQTPAQPQPQTAQVPAANSKPAPAPPVRNNPPPKRRSTFHFNPLGWLR